MSVRQTVFAAAAALVMIRCASTTAPMTPAAPSRAEDRFLIDPRIGYTVPVAPSIVKRFDAAWRAFLSGDDVVAEKRLADLRTKQPDYEPALLAGAAIRLRRGDVEAARAIVDDLVARQPGYTAAQVYQAEVALARKEVRRAWEIDRAVAARAGAPPEAIERAAELQTKVFEQFYSAALTAPADEAIVLLRQALQVNPAATSARVLLAGKLVARGRFEEARPELAPVLGTADGERPEVQEALAEIEVSSGQYQEAINRYERLTRRGANPRYTIRLDEIKGRFAEANMPPQFRRAVESDAITRGDLAVLMYWKVSSIRFAQNLAAPPIAIDIGEIPGRDEIVRAIALGIYQIDSVTRRVNPNAQVSARDLTRTAARLLVLRRAPCAGGSGADIGDGRAQKVLSGCVITDPSLAGAEMTVSGRTAASVLDQVDRALK